MDYGYQIRYYSSTNDLVLLDVPFIQIEYGQKANDVGACSMLIPLEFWNSSLMTYGSFIEIWRYNPSVDSVQLVGQTCWFLYQWRVQIDKNQVELVFYDSNIFFKNRVMAFWKIVNQEFWQSLVGANSYPNFGSGQFETLDDVQKYLVKYCFTYVGVDPITDEDTRVMSTIIGNYAGLPFNSRVNPLIEIAPFNSAGITYPFYCVEEDTLLTALQRCATTSKNLGYPIEYRMKYIPFDDSSRGGSFLFENAVPSFGIDHSLNENLTLHADAGHLADVEIFSDYSQHANIVLVHGMELEQWFSYLGLASNSDGIDDYLTVTAQDTSYDLAQFVLGVTEVSIAAPDDATASSFDFMEQYAIQQLYSTYRPTVRLSGDIVQNQQVMFFRDYNFLDTIRIEGYGLSFNAKVDKYTVTVDANGEKIRIPFDALTTINEVTLSRNH